jgi:hypothetical protein
VVLLFLNQGRKEGRAEERENGRHVIKELIATGFKISFKPKQNYLNGKENNNK